MKKMIKLINNERTNIKISSQKAVACEATNSYDECVTVDQAQCYMNSYDYCYKDMAACMNYGYDYCSGTDLKSECGQRDIT